MYLKSLEVAGFKSFARKTTLTFTTPITAIVGPNGSGKSNTAESFRFVLGEQSMKSMRGKRGEDLIFGGTASTARGNRASVKMTLDNALRLLDIDYDEVTIERVVYRDGTNQYTLNGAQVRLKDILALLAGAHVGASGHHIISQGEADRILNASSKERRGMIEEALGLRVFQYKKQESEQKLTRTQENMKEVELLRKEIAPHLRFLNKQVEKIEAARLLCTELTERYQEYFKRESLYLEEEEVKLRGAREENHGQLAAVEARLAAARGIAQQQAEEGPHHARLREEEAALSTVREEKARITHELGRLEGMIDALRRQQAAVERERARREVALKEMQQSANDVASEQAVSDLLVPFQDICALVDAIEERITHSEFVTELEPLHETLRGIRDMALKFLAHHERAAVAHPRMVPQHEPLPSFDVSELTTLTKERALLSEALEALHQREREHQQVVVAMRNAIEREQVQSRAAERDVVLLVAEQQQLQITQNELIRADDTLERDKELFMRELSEAATVVSQEVLRYRDYIVPDEEESTLPPREAQRERRTMIERMKIRLEEMGGVSGDEIMKEYEETKARDEFLAREVADLAQSKATLLELIDELTEQLNRQFKEGVKTINTQFNTFFTLMFGGGFARLSLVARQPRGQREQQGNQGNAEHEGADQTLAPQDGQSQQESEEGIDIEVSLPNKRVKGLEILSGGERALTSIALIFAISQVHPPPFLILDETDAALDEANSRKYGDMIATLAEHSQLILITHNRETMSRAGVLYGVTMGSDGVSQLLSVKLDEAIAVAK